MKRALLRAVAAALCGIALSGCIDSSGPLLPAAQAIFGDDVRLQFYALHKGVADEPEEASFKWDGMRYVRTAGGMRDVGSFSLHAFWEDRLIVQSESVRRSGVYEYALAHKLTDGVYQVVAIDEEDADAATRRLHCKSTQDSTCRIETREQLVAFAGTTALRRKGEGGLVIRLANGRPESSK